MTEGETNAGTNPAFPYTFSREDAVRGGQARTERKAHANAVKALRTGKYSKTLSGDFLWCSSCSLAKACAFFTPGSSCRIVNLPTFKNLALLWKSDPSDFLKETSRALMELQLAIKAKGNRPRHLTAYVQLLVKIFEAKFGSRHLVGVAGFEQASQQVVVSYDRRFCQNCVCESCSERRAAEGERLKALEPESATDSPAAPESEPTAPDSETVSGGVVEPEPVQEMLKEPENLSRGWFKKKPVSRLEEFRLKDSFI